MMRASAKATPSSPPVLPRRARFEPRRAPPRTAVDHADAATGATSGCGCAQSRHPTHLPSCAAAAAAALWLAAPPPALADAAKYVPSPMDPGPGVWAGAVAGVALYALGAWEARGWRGGGCEGGCEGLVLRWPAQARAWRDAEGDFPPSATSRPRRA